VLRRLKARTRMVMGDDLPSEAYNSGTLKVLKVLGGGGGVGVGEDGDVFDEHSAREELVSICGRIEKKLFDDLRTAAVEVALLLASPAYVAKAAAVQPEFGVDITVNSATQSRDSVIVSLNGPSLRVN